MSAEVPRRTLLDRLRRRWEVPVTTIRAPGGFGKSTVVHQMRVADGPWLGQEYIVACQPRHADPAVLFDDLAHVLGDTVPPADRRGDGVRRVAATMAGRSPALVSLVLDDIHLMVDDEPAAAISAMIRSLPANAHLVLVGRDLPDVGLNELRARGRILEIGEDDLRLTPAEVQELLLRHGADGTDPADLAGLGGWPALVRLAIATGHEAPVEYLRGEVMATLTPEHRRGLAALVIAKGLDDRTLGAVSGADASRLAETVPLVDRRSDGTVVAHDLWSDALDQLVDPDTEADLVAAVVSAHASAGRRDQAFRLAAEHDRWDLAARTAAATIGRGHGVGVTATRRWLALVPDCERERPELILLDSLRTRLDHDPAGGVALARQALSGFEAAGDEAGEAAALSELTWGLWAARDVGGILAVYDRAKELAARYPGSLTAMVALVQAAIADLQGEPRVALEHLAGFGGSDQDPAIAGLVWNWTASLEVLNGDTRSGLRAAERALSASTTFGGRPMQLVLSRWFHGEVEDALGSATEWHEARTELSARDRFLTDVYTAVIGASVGQAVPVDADDLRRRGGGTGRDLVFAAVAAAASCVVCGDEGEARGLLLDVVERCGPDDALAIGELLRFLPYVAVLAPELLPHLEHRATGPAHARNLALARLLTDCRTGRRARWSALPRPGQVICALPLPWTLEVAAHAHTAGRIEGLMIAELALELADDDDAEPIRRRLCADPRLAPLLEPLLAAVPVAPSNPVRIGVLGPVSIDRAGDQRPTDHGPALSAEAATLVSHLAVHRSASTGMTARVLWPADPPTSAHAAIDLLLTEIAAAAEPDRPADAPAHTVRRRGDRLALASPSHLQVDLWEAQDLVAAGEALEGRGDLADAASAFERAIQLCRGSLLPALTGHLGERPEHRRAAARILDAGCRAGELRYALHDERRARRDVEAVLRLDPGWARARRLAHRLASEGRP